MPRPVVRFDQPPAHRGAVESLTMAPQTARRLKNLLEIPAVEAPPKCAPIVEHFDHDAPSVFNANSMLREARRQKELDSGTVPAVCVLDPDGDIVRHLCRTQSGVRSKHWACFHTELWTCDLGGIPVGFVGCAVGGPFSVLVAEQLFASGCEIVLNISSAGQIGDTGIALPYFVLIERALRDEGTSYHYLPPAPYVAADPELLSLVQRAFASSGCHFRQGATWTTDAPFRETAEMIADRRREGILAVDMEAASLYAFGKACSRPVICVAHVTNRLECLKGDFDKGESNGACSTLTFVEAFATAWMERQSLNRRNGDEKGRHDQAR